MMYSKKVFKAVEKAAASAVDHLEGNLKPHESMAWGAVMDPYHELLDMMKGGKSPREIEEDYWENTSFYQYAVFDSAYGAFLDATRKS